MSDFDRIADSYRDDVESGMILKGNNHDYFQEYKMIYLGKIIKQYKVKKILDYGCGIGTLAQFIHVTFPELVIHGFDISSKSIQDIPGELKEYPNYFTSEYNTLSHDYDLVIVSTVLHHVPIPDRHEVMKKIYNTMKQHGHLVVIEHNMINPLTRKSVAECPFDDDAIMLSVNECKTLVKNTNFKNVHRKYITFFPKQLSFMRGLDSYIGWLPLGAQYMIIGEK
mgnify:FL=1